MVIEIKGNIAHRMSTSNFQLRHDGLRWRIKLMILANICMLEEVFEDEMKIDSGLSVEM